MAPIKACPGGLCNPLCNGIHSFPPYIRECIRILLTEDRHDVMVSAIVWCTRLACGPGVTAGGLKNKPRSPPSNATIGAAARRLGKVWQPKSIQAPARCPPAWPTNEGWRRKTTLKGKEICLVCKLAKHWLWPLRVGVRKGKKALGKERRLSTGHRSAINTSMVWML